MLGEVLTRDAFPRMIDLATAFTEGVQGSIEEFDVPWSIAQLGARAESRFTAPSPRTGEESAAAADSSPVRGAGAVKRYSARAPSWAMGDGTSH